MATGSVDHLRPFEVSGPAIDVVIKIDHPDTSGEVARPFLDIGAQPAPSDQKPLTHKKQSNIQILEIIVAAGPEMAGKATEPFWTTPCPLSTLSWDLGAKSAAASEQTAS